MSEPMTDERAISELKDIRERMDFPSVHYLHAIEHAIAALRLRSKDAEAWQIVKDSCGINGRFIIVAYADCFDIELGGEDFCIPREDIGLTEALDMQPQEVVLLAAEKLKGG